MAAKDEPSPVEQAWAEETWHTGYGNWHEDAFPIYTDVCVYHEGVHYPGNSCPHYDDVIDEMDPGWTVLKDRQ